MAAEDAAQKAHALQRRWNTVAGSTAPGSRMPCTSGREWVPVAEVCAWLAADVVRADEASALRELGISADQVGPRLTSGSAWRALGGGRGPAAPQRG